MIHAYDKNYLDDAMQNLGEAFDYAVNVCGKEIDEFMQLFIVSGFSEQFEKGTPKIISGTSGTELVIEIISKTGLKQEFPEAQIEYDYSPEYPRTSFYKSSGSKIKHPSYISHENGDFSGCFLKISQTFHL